MSLPSTLPVTYVLGRPVLLALVASVLVTSSCTEPSVSPDRDPGGSEDVIGDAPRTPDLTVERRVLTELTRAVALALAEPRARREVLRDMRLSRHTPEHKLELRRYLRPGATHLLAAMAKVTGVTEDSLLALVGAIRPLEFYMPVRHQRETWAGGAEVVVASLLEDEDVPIVFDLSGSHIDIKQGEVPALPTLALVPVETDFSRPLDSRGLENIAAPGVRAIGTWVAASPPRQPSGFASELELQSDEDCPPPSETELQPAPCEGSGGGGPAYGIVPATAPAGLYMTYTDLYDDGEASIRGNPEIEAYVVGPFSTDHRDDIRVLTCAGESQPAPRNFNQDAHGWSGYVLLMSEQEFQSYKFIDSLPDNRQFSVILYEDDDTRCQIRDNENRFFNHLQWLAYWGFTGYKVVKHCERPGSNDTMCGLAVWGLVFWARQILWSWFQSNDDYLGLAIERSHAPPDFSLPAANYALIRDQTALNGGIRLEYHQPPSP